jgi:DNA polymerase IV
MPVQTIAHVDMDAFYASIEIRDDPSLAGRPVVVGGAKEGRGVVAAASYEARRHGIHSAMPMAQAERLCPALVRVAPNFLKYQDASRIIMGVMGEFSPAIEPLSLDEAFLDLTGTEVALGPAREVGVRIKARIREETALTASVGIAPVKFVSKIASDLEKPDGLVVVEPGQVEAFLRPLPISRLWGVGPHTAAVLESAGFHTIGQLAAAEPRALETRFGENGQHLYNLARGIDERNVVPDWEAKSYSHEETFATDVKDCEVLESTLLDQSVRVSRRLRSDAVTGRVVQLKLRYHDFHTLTRRITLSAPTADPDRIFETVRALFRANWNGKPVRLIGAGVSAIAASGGENLDLFEPPGREDKNRRLVETIDRIEDRFGSGKITRARLVDRKRLISESITPLPGTFEAEAMGRGEPGLPAGFTWRDQSYTISACLRVWKQARPEAGGELYVRRHYFTVVVQDGSEWTVYCLRQAPQSGSPKRRWYLYSVG